MLAKGILSVRIPVFGAVLSLIQSAASLFHGVPKPSEILRSSIGNILLRNTFVDKRITGIMITYMNLECIRRLRVSDTNTEHPSITAGGTNVTMNLSPVAGKN